MKKLFAAFAFVGFAACSSSAPPEKVAPVKVPQELSLEAASGKCPWYAPRCCGFTRPDGTCVGNCVARNAQCP